MSVKCEFANGFLRIQPVHSCMWSAYYTSNHVVCPVMVVLCKFLICSVFVFSCRSRYCPTSRLHHIMEAQGTSQAAYGREGCPSWEADQCHHSSSKYCEEISKRVCIWWAVGVIFLQNVWCSKSILRYCDLVLLIQQAKSIFWPWHVIVRLITCLYMLMFVGTFLC